MTDALGCIRIYPLSVPSFFIIHLSTTNSLNFTCFLPIWYHTTSAIHNNKQKKQNSTLNAIAILGIFLACFYTPHTHTPTPHKRNRSCKPQPQPNFFKHTFHSSFLPMNTYCHISICITYFTSDSMVYI